MSALFSEEKEQNSCHLRTPSHWPHEQRARVAWGLSNFLQGNGSEKLYGRGD